MATITAPLVRVTPQERRRAVVAGTIGNLVEWFDWSIFGFFTPYFATQLFPRAPQVTQIVQALLVFAVGFLVRPLGGAVLGSYADRHGRRAGMTLTILLMAAASLLMAVIPPFAMIGMAAPLLLVLARCAQGFSAGGEFGTSSAFLVENARPGRRAFIGSWQQVSVGGGTLLASILASIMFNTADVAWLRAWGWRIAFGLGAVLGLLGLYLRMRVAETEAFANVAVRKETARRPLVQVLREHPLAVLRVVALVAAGTGLVQFWFLFLPTFANLQLHANLKVAQVAATLALAVFTVLQPVSGWLSDRFGRKPLLLVFAIGSALAIVPALLLMKPTLPGILLPAAVAAVFLAAYAGSLAAVMAEQFPAALRTAGISLPYGIAVAIFGGFFPVVATKAIEKGNVLAFAIGVAVLCVASAVVYVFMPETKDREL